MKRTPLKRKTRLKAKPGSNTRTTKSRSKPRRSSRIRSKEYMARVRELPCMAKPYFRDLGNGYVSIEKHCRGPIEAHHAGERPLGRKANDDTCIPLCSGHHRDWHAATGPFGGWHRMQRREWANRVIGYTQAALGYTGAGK